MRPWPGDQILAQLAVGAIAGGALGFGGASPLAALVVTACLVASFRLGRAWESNRWLVTRIRNPNESETR